MSNMSLLKYFNKLPKENPYTAADKSNLKDTKVSTLILSGLFVSYIFLFAFYAFCKSMLQATKFFVNRLNIWLLWIQELIFRICKKNNDPD